MHRKSAIATLLVVLCAAWWSRCFSPEPSARPWEHRRRRRRFQPAGAASPNSARPGEPADRVQVEVFPVGGVRAMPWPRWICPSRVGGDPRGLSRLAERGRPGSCTAWTRRPIFARACPDLREQRAVVQEVSRSKEGQVATSINYQETGLRLQVSGGWEKGERDELWASANVDLQWSSWADQGAAGERHPVPAFGKFNFAQSLQLRSGAPALFLASQQPIVSGGESQTTIGVVRVTLTHLED